MEKSLILAENWIKDGRNFLGLRETSAGFIALLYRSGAKEIKVQLIDDERASKAARIELPSDIISQREFLVKLITCRPDNVYAELDENTSSVIWLRMVPGTEGGA